MPFEFRRVVTGHDADGRAVVRTDEIVTSEPRLPGYQARVVWSTSDFPPSNDETSVVDRAPGKRGSRILFRVGEFTPGESAGPYLHRTETQDVAVVLTGRLDMTLDSGEVVEELAPGDVVVQRGTMHAWVARGPEPVRVLFVLMESEPVRVGDRLLSEDLEVFEGRVSPMSAHDDVPVPRDAAGSVRRSGWPR